jgi:hypothetical protein
MAGISRARNRPFAQPGAYPLTVPKHWANPVPGNLRVNYVCPAPALGGILMHQLASRQIVVLTYVFGQSAVHQCVGFETKFFVPRAILGLPSQHIFQSASREIFRPKGHSVLISSEAAGKNRRKIGQKPLAIIHIHGIVLMSLIWHLRISPARPLSSDPAPIHKPTKRKKEMKNIFVGNLNFGATEDAVRSMFEAYGTVEKVNLITDRDTGQARGFGFVEMSVNADADRAIAELNGRELDGRALNVNEARPKTDRGGSGGGGGGGGRRNNNRW